jgi:glycerol-1-phosphate dehydrogenase [NAD(P)+]
MCGVTTTVIKLIEQRAKAAADKNQALRRKRAEAMNYERITTALREAPDTRSVTIDTGALATVATAFADSFGEQPGVIVADDITFEVAGRLVQERLEASGCNLVEPIIFPGTPALYADYQHVLALETRLNSNAAIPVVVGSGTLNDITKLAAHRSRRPYMIVATAASMDGYTAFGAAITCDGFKQTFACPAPWAVIADLDILARAPFQLTASGYGDLLGKITAGADWLIADALGIEPIDPHAWTLVQLPLRTWTADPVRLAQGDRQAVSNLVEGLILCGLAMQAHQTSRPASGSEHQFSHLWEMESVGGHDGRSVSHGFKVGIGTIASAALFERMLTRDLGAIDIGAVQSAWPTRDAVVAAVRASHTIPIMATKAVEESLAKYIDADQLDDRLRSLRLRWTALQHDLIGQLLTAEQVRCLLNSVGAPTDPAMIGIDRGRLKRSYQRARQIRRRYTVFDLAAEAGVLDICVDELFAPGGFWNREAAALDLADSAG